MLFLTIVIYAFSSKQIPAFLLRDIKGLLKIFVKLLSPLQIIPLNSFATISFLLI
jgi:hypothetical protein